MFLAIIFVLATYAMSAQDQWCEASELPSEGSLMMFSDAANGWVVSGRHVVTTQYIRVLRTRDSAKTWELDQEWFAGTGDRTERIIAFDMVDSLNGWIGGSRYFGWDKYPSLYRRAWVPGTVGIQWHFVDTKLPAGEEIRAIKVFSPKRLLVATSRGLIAKSIDDGESWTVIDTVEENLQVTQMHFIDEASGWLASYEHLYRTTNGGSSWEKIDYGKPFWITSISFMDRDTGWLGGEAGRISKTTNAGATWSSQWSTTGSRIEDFAFLNANVGYAVGGGVNGGNGWLDSSRVLKTEDGGNTWLQIKHPRDVWIGGISLIDSNTGYILAGQYVYRYCGDPLVSVKEDAIQTEPNCESLFFDLLGRRIGDEAAGIVIEYDPCKAKGRVIVR